MLRVKLALPFEHAAAVVDQKMQFYIMAVLACHYSGIYLQRKRFSRFMVSLLALLAVAFAPATGQMQAEVPVSTPEELRNALEAGATRVAIMKNMNFNPENWPDPPVVITKSVTIVSPYRCKLDFCGSKGAPARPLIIVNETGSLLLQRVFLRNFLPAAPQNLSGLGPVPALLSNGGLISFRIVVFHFLPSVTWAFDAPLAESFWAQARSSIMTNMYDGTPLRLDEPALYLLKYTTRRYSIETCYSPVDLNACYADDDEDTTLVYCLFTLADSLRNPYVRYIRVFHDVGVDRTAYTRFKPVTVTQPKSYSACPGARPSLNMDGILHGVAVRDAVEFRGFRFKDSLPTNYTTWPPSLPLLLSLFDVDGPGSVTIADSVIEVPDLPPVVSMLRGLPSCCYANPALPNLQPAVETWPSPEELARATAVSQQTVPDNEAAGGGGTIFTAWGQPKGAAAGGGNGGGSGSRSDSRGTLPGFTITKWVLPKNSWMQYSTGRLYDVLSTPAAAKWAFDNVTVQQANGVNSRALCFGAALEQGSVQRSGIAFVADDGQLRAALARGARYIQVVADIKLNPVNWPIGNAVVSVDSGMVEVRGCHPVAGQRFTIDLSDLMSVIRVKGRLVFEGDLRFTGVGWSVLPQSALVPVVTGAVDMSLLGALLLAPNTGGGVGLVELEGVLIDGEFTPSSALRPVDLLDVVKISQTAVTSLALNVTLRSTSLILGVWSFSENATQAGNWAFIQTEVSWDSKHGTDGGLEDGGGDDNGLLKILIPSIIGGVLLVALVVVAVLYVRCRKRGACALSKLGMASAGQGNHKSFRSLCGPNAASQVAPSQKEGDAAAALEAVLQAATKMLTSTAGSNTSVSGTKTDMSGMAAAAVAMAALGRVRSEQGLGMLRQGAAAREKPGEQPAPTSRVTGRPDAAAAAAALEGRDRGPLSDINAAKCAMVAGRPAATHDVASPIEDLVLQSVLGEGSYGRVYRALWRGTTVAVKVILLPAHMSGRERHERMAVMEAAISSSLSHPNIVQTFTFGVECVEGAKARAAGLRRGPRGNSVLRDASSGTVDEGTVAVGPGPAGQMGGAVDCEDDIVGWEIRLVQEYCDLGSLRDKLNTRAFFRPAPAAAGAVPVPPPLLPSPSEGTGYTTTDEERQASLCSVASPQLASTSPAGTPGPSSTQEAGGGGDGGGGWVVDLAAVLDTAIDVARAVSHLHREGIVHADLKPRNVLLKGSTTDPRGFVAKVADFGLSMRLDVHETHVSNAYHGTLAYMAPETLLNGHVSRPSDVYGFGILLYELYTGDTAFRGVPKALIGHAITKENLRPVFPAALGAPFEYQLLACRCWESNPEIRPEFDFILEDLKRMRLRLCAITADLSSVATGANMGGVSRFGEGGADRWGLPNLAQPTSQQGNHFVMRGHPGGAGGGGYTDDRTLSASNSVSLSAASATVGPTASAAALVGVARQLIHASRANLRSPQYPAGVDAPGVDEEAADAIRSL